jgi:RNA 3'-terminal phosphate cyclase-like protein
MGVSGLPLRGSQQFRQRLILATLTGTPLRITDIRLHDSAPGLRDYEASFLRLLEKLSNGCVVEINETGMSSRFLMLLFFFVGERKMRD